MNERLRRIGAIVDADVRIRFRRLSTVVMFLIMTIAAYAWVPSPASGRALLQINGQRCLYNSAAIGMATASLSTFIIGLFGYYVISNAIARDARTRCGYVIASTTMGSTDYLIGKFAGNALFLLSFTAAFMVSAMGMLLVRGEAPLQPFIFAKQYALIVPPTVVLVSAVAILFESIPLLSGRFGDLTYFFFWMFVTVFTIVILDKKWASVGFIGAFDVTGLGYVLDQTRKTLHTTSMSIGASAFDPKKPVFVFQGLQWDWAWLLPRTLSMLLPVPVIALARIAFHRFDPTRVKQSASRHGMNLWSRINRLFAFLTRPLTRLGTMLIARGGKPSILRSALADALLTISATPLIAVAIVVFSIASLSTTSVLPAVFVAMAISIADIASREARAGTTALVWSAPLIKPWYSVWKMLSSMTIAALFLVAPLMRGAGFAAVSGALFLCGASTFLGLTTKNPKTFTVLFLSFWYLSLNDKGANPWLDFAGFNHAATATTIATYATLALALSWFSGVAPGKST